MRAMVLPAIVNLDRNPAPLVLIDKARPVPGHGEILVEVSVCGVCHTELDEIEGSSIRWRMPMRHCWICVPVMCVARKS